VSKNSRQETRKPGQPAESTWEVHLTETDSVPGRPVLVTAATMDAGGLRVTLRDRAGEPVFTGTSVLYALRAEVRTLTLAASLKALSPQQVRCLQEALDELVPGLIVVAVPAAAAEAE
jgi:hypothetical protein